jgi:hypothetical protein
LPFDDRNRSVAKANLVAGVDDGSTSNRGGIGQIGGLDVGLITDAGVVVAGRVGGERVGAAARVAEAGRVELERISPNYS